VNYIDFKMHGATIKIMKATSVSSVSEIIDKTKRKWTNYAAMLTCLRECFNSISWQRWGHSRGIGSE